jgi:methylmalonyl-CoA epimerase
VARFLEKRGEGLHHICLRVDDIEEAMERLRAAGVQLLSEEPRVGAHGNRYVFVHPKSAHGVLLEVYEVKG